MAIINKESVNRKWIWDIDTENNTDSWVPVINNNLIQHKVEEIYSGELPRNTTYTTAGSIHLYVRGKIACIQIANVIKTNTNRTTIATLPAKYKPVQQWYGLMSPYPNAANFIIESSTGEIKTEGSMNSLYGSVVFPIA